MSDSFVDGPAPVPADAALSWLAEAGERRVQVPVHVTRGAFGPTATLGTGEGAAALRLDSTALGRTLDDHLADHCGKDTECLVWIEGTWGPLVGPASDKPTLAVRKVVGKVDDPAKATLRIQGS
jgi:hypothetical protein